MGQLRPFSSSAALFEQAETATEFMDATFQAVLWMHNRILAETRLDSAALADVAALAEGLARRADAWGWADLGHHAMQISYLARQPLPEWEVFVRRARLGQLFFEIDRTIAAKKASLSSP